MAQEVGMESKAAAATARPKEERKVSQFPQEVYDPEHPYKDWDPSAPYVLSDEEEEMLMRGELVDLG